MAAVLQVADLFDAHAAEAPIHRLVSVLNAQAAQIRELQQTLQMVQTTQRQTLADCSALHAAVASLDPQVQRAEDDVAELNQFRGTAQQQLRAINRQLQGKAERQEVADVDVRAQSASEQLAKQLRSELASLQLVQCLQAEQSELHYRLETVDRRLASKMDKSEATRLDAVLVQIHGFRPMVTQLETQVASVQTQQKRIERSVARLDSEREKRQIELEDVRKHTDELQQMLDGAEQRHHRTVGPLVQRLDRSVDELQIAVDELKTTAATSDTALRTLSAKFHSSANAFASQMQQQHCRLERILDEKAPRQEIQAQLADLNRKVDTKVPDSVHKSLSASVKNLRAHCEKMQKHIELSTRFLDWFARRGEAYEHNLELVETQLGRLALASHPSSREPFGGRVRFPQSPTSF